MTIRRPLPLGILRYDPDPIPRTLIDASAPTGPLFCLLAPGAGPDSELHKPLPHPLLPAVGVADHLEAAGVEEAARAGPGECRWGRPRKSTAPRAGGEDHGVYGVTGLRNRQSAKATRGEGFRGGSWVGLSRG